MRKIYAIGETVFDITFKSGKPLSAKAGGSALNTSVTLGRLNLPVSFIGEFANDNVGTIINNFLLENNVDTKNAIWNNDGQNVVALAFLDANNDAQYNFYKNPPNARFNFDYPEIQKNDIVYFGSISSIDPESRDKIVDFIKFAKEQGALVMYDPNYRVSHFKGKSTLRMFQENISLANIIRGSNEDFKNIFDTEDINDVYENLNTSNQILIYTKNADGVYLKTSNRNTFVESKKITPVSTIGAGDTFNAGLIYGVYKNEITKNNLQHVNLKTWTKIISDSIEFASHVCMSYENYVSLGFAKQVH